ncbi:MAG: NAD(P)-dependent oxidoreductase [Betaproteobacteria bacterium]|nr:NAD(P)-dependent oxidoreductase [Betaproteobacteria bacterium]
MSLPSAPMPPGAAILSGMRAQVFGLGALGSEIAARLITFGAQVQGIDINHQAQSRWRDTHAWSEVAEPSVVVLCVTDQAASSMVFEQYLDRCPPGTLVIEHGTVSPEFAYDSEQRCRRARLRYADAPLSGGVAGAQQGKMVAMLGCDLSHQPDVEQVLSAYCARVVHLGNAGAGQRCKLANQLAIAGIAAGLAAAQRFSREQGLPLTQVFEALSLGSAHSVQMERLRESLSHPLTDPGQLFAWLEKDLDLCASVSSQALPLHALWRKLWESPS